MAVSSAYLDFVTELLSPLGAITTRRMFSGKGVYLDGTIFAFVVADTLHFKVDDGTRPTFVAEGSGPFTYETATGTKVINGYWRAPERLFDEPDAMLEFARVAYITALRAARKKPEPKKKPTMPRKKSAARR